MCDFEYDYDNDFAQKWQSPSTMNTPSLKHDTKFCRYCIYLDNPECKHPEYNHEYDCCERFMSKLHKKGDPDVPMVL